MVSCRGGSAWVVLAAAVFAACGSDDTGDDGDVAGSGGALSGVGGGSPGSGGEPPGVGGSSQSAGSTVSGVGGASSSVGGGLPGSGGEPPGIGGSSPTTGGAMPGTGGTVFASGGAFPSLGGTSSGGASVVSTGTGGRSSSVGGGSSASGGASSTGGRSGSGGASATCAEGSVSCDGVCTQLATDELHCGDCDTACSNGSVCVSGVCECMAGADACPLGCFDLQSDSQHCGSCSNACPQGVSCVLGVCEECPSGVAACSGECVDLQTNSQHCGECGASCSGGQTCLAGECVCAQPLSACGDLCVDLSADSAHCGECETACAEGASCQDGTCRGAEGDGPDGCGGLAQGLSIDRVAIYQAVEIDLMRDQTAVALDQRNADVIVGRDAVVRVFYALESGFTPREISMRVIVETGGASQTLYARKQISQSSQQESLATTFQVEVAADLIASDTTFAVEAVECGSAGSGSQLAPRYPSEGSVSLSARETGPLTVAVVPVVVGEWVPDTSDEALAVYRNYVQALYPITEITTTVIDPLSVSGGFDWDTLVDQLRDRRASDGPADNVLYYGLVRPARTLMDYCMGECITGVGYLVDTMWGAADYQVSCGVAYADDVSVGTMAHEMGHTLGRDHAPCGVTGDNAFPYAGGGIGTWGFDLRTSELYSPDNYADIMGYCTPQWMSDYTYQNMADRIARLNGEIEMNVTTLSDSAERWRVLLGNGGRLRWGIPYREEKPAYGAPEPARILGADGAVIATTTVYATPTTLGASKSYLVPPPSSGWTTIEIEGVGRIAFE